jgi:hypothetical protein
VHVGVEEAVAEHLREEDRHAVARQLLDVDAGVAQALRWLIGTPFMRSITITLGGAQLPVLLGLFAQLQAGPCCAKLGRVGGFAHRSSSSCR